MDISFAYYPGAKKKALTMSYDDGQIFDRRLVEIFNKYGIRGSFHLNSGKFDSEPFLDSVEIRDLFKGHEISAHSVNHPFLTKIPEEAIVEEIREDRRKLEELAAYPVRGMSYPYGDYNQDLVKLLPALGIDYSRTVHSHGRFTLPDNFLSWHPTCHHEDNLMVKCNEFLNLDSYLQMPLFYVWGHSFEFDRDNNWDLIEEFSKVISNNDEIWYATNIEIMDYINALKALKFSVNRKKIYNPSAMSVWIELEGQPLKIEAGENIVL
ncbi:MAG: polysaccharide deacetylase family protein [bacterium]